MELLTTTAFETSAGLRLLEIVHGSIVEADDPVIAISSHANPGLPLWGSALDALSAAWNVALTDCEMHPLLVVAGSIGTYHLRCGAKQQLLVTRIPGALSVSRTGDEPERVLRDAFWTLFCRSLRWS